MKVWFVSRHQGAIEWIKDQNIKIDHFVSHVEKNKLNPGDCVIGTLPIHVVAELCLKGIEYWNLSLELPYQARGKELSKAELIKYGARLERFTAQKICISWNKEINTFNKPL